MSSTFLAAADRLMKQAGSPDPVGSLFAANSTPEPLAGMTATPTAGKWYQHLNPFKRGTRIGFPTLIDSPARMPMVPVNNPQLTTAASRNATAAPTPAAAAAEYHWHGPGLRSQAAEQLKKENPHYAAIWGSGGSPGPMWDRASQVAREMAEGRLAGQGGKLPTFSTGGGAFNPMTYNLQRPDATGIGRTDAAYGAFPWSVTLHELEHARQDPRDRPAYSLEVGPSLGDVANAAEISRRLGNGQRSRGEVDITPSYSMPIEEMRREAQRGGALYGGKTYTELLNSPAGQAWLRDRYKEFETEQFPWRSRLSSIWRGLGS